VFDPFSFSGCVYGSQFRVLAVVGDKKGGGKKVPAARQIFLQWPNETFGRSPEFQPA
jgi:hypothetical protein